MDVVGMKLLNNQYPKRKRNMNELALFAGSGGGILGGKLLGWRTVCAVEWEPYPASVLCARQNDGLLETFPIWDDVCTFDGRPWRGLVDVISGGFPCQDISAAGKGAGIDGERSGMWGEMARIIHEVRPRFVFVENSPMLTSRGLGRVLGDLASMGFDARWGVLGAADIGANHQRDRIWIVAKWRGQLPHAQHNRIRRWEQQQKSIEETSDDSNTNLVHDALRGDSQDYAESMGEWGIHARGSVCNSGAGCEESSGQSTRDEEVSNTNCIGLDESETKWDRIYKQQICADKSDNWGEVRSETVGCNSSGGKREISDSDRIRSQDTTDKQELESQECSQLQTEQPRNTSQVAFTESKGLEGWNNRGNHEQAKSRLREVGWSVETNWIIEPDVGRVANGVAARVDRLKAIGNGQVPLCAATAWRILSEL
jgi:site-specific DNA-cytosine methylase